MTFLERTTDARRLRHWDVDMSVDYIYTSGHAGETFFRTLREEGRLLAAHCATCDLNYLPPRMFCEKCFAETAVNVEVPGEGAVAAVTVAYVGRRGKPLEAPQVWALVSFKGIHGGLLHRLLVPADRAKPGLAVRVRVKPREARTGTILDIEGFVPAASQV